MNPRIATCALCVFLVSASISTATTFYVSPTGSDTNSGTSTGAPWQTIAKVNSVNFAAGDTILFQGGSTFSGKIYLDAGDTGVEANRITVGSYGTGRAVIDGGPGGAILVYNTGGIVISNLEVKGAGIGANDGTGIEGWTDLPGRRPGIRIENCEVYGFGLHVKPNNHPESGNGIFFWGWRADSQLTGFDNLEVIGTIVRNCENTGLGTWAHVLSGLSNVTVRDCTFHSNPGRSGLSNHSGNGIVLGSVGTGLIERCVAYGNGANNTSAAGPVGIWTYESTNVTIQYCESYNNRTAGGDGGGFDLDGGVTNSVIQYCYSHGNYGAGYLLACYGGASQMANNTIRYNISENDGRRGNYGGIVIWGNGASDKIENTRIHNNIIYTGTETPVVSGIPAAVRFLNANAVGLKFWNNIFLTRASNHRLVSSDTALATTVAEFQGNNYWAFNTFALRWGGTTYSSFSAWTAAASTQERIAGSLVGKNLNPLLAAPGAGGTIGDPYLLQNLSAYQLSETSPMRDAALDLQALFSVSPGPNDFYETPLGAGNQLDIGAHELAEDWTNQDIGSPSVAGSTSYNSDTDVFTVKGGGAISGTSDSFQYAWRTLAGDGQIVARVYSISASSGWARSGIMIRETLAANSKFAFAYVMKSNNAAFGRRTSTGGSVSATTAVAAATPLWLKLVRAGNTFTAYRSADGVNWVSFGSQSITMVETVHIGLAVSSHSSSLATATIDLVDVQ